MEEEKANNGAPMPNGLAEDAARLGRLMRRDARIRAGFVAVGWNAYVTGPGEDARSVLALARDPNDPDGEQGTERVLVHVGSNW